MKINGQEIDMQKVLQLIENETKHHKPETKKKIKDWWNSTAGQIQREKQREFIQEKKCHRQKIEYELVNINDPFDSVELTGQQAVAQFLGYKKWNSSMNVDIRANKSKTKIYNIIRK